MKNARFAMRLLGRLTVLAVVGTFAVIFGLQYARIIGKNVEISNQYTAAQNDVRVLEAKRARADRQIRRLSDPAGAIPEIHDKLHLVGDHEAIIYLKNHDDRP
jgi:cell division protein FtsB